MKCLDGAGWFMKCSKEHRLGGNDVTKNTKGLMNDLRHCIDRAILESNDVAAIVAALKRIGKYPLYTVDISLQDGADPATQPLLSKLTEDLVLSDSDVEFLASMGISDPSWCCGATESGTA